MLATTASENKERKKNSNNANRLEDKAKTAVEIEADHSPAWS